jgi:hypothetical protein
LDTIDVHEVRKQRYSEKCWRRNGLNKYDFSSQIKQIGIDGTLQSTNQQNNKNAKKLDDFGDAKLPRTSNERHQKCTRVSRKETE